MDNTRACERFRTWGRGVQQIEFTIPGRIRGKGRPKFARRGKFVQAYTPADTANCEAMVRSLGAEAMAGTSPFEGPLVLDVTLTQNTPPSWSKKKRAAALHITGKPDVDNIVKLLGDALNGIIWGDDSQICQLHVRRFYDDTNGEKVLISVHSPFAKGMLP
jgi:Holliday junction resolvase RusA-like endonuclease